MYLSTPEKENVHEKVIGTSNLPNYKFSLPIKAYHIATTFFNEDVESNPVLIFEISILKPDYEI